MRRPGAVTQLDPDRVRPLLLLAGHCYALELDPMLADRGVLVQFLGPIVDSADIANVPRRLPPILAILPQFGDQRCGPVRSLRPFGVLLEPQPVAVHEAK